MIECEPSKIMEENHSFVGVTHTNLVRGGEEAEERWWARYEKGTGNASCLSKINF